MPLSQNKKPIDQQLIKHLREKYSLSRHQAMIFIDRGIVYGEDIKFFLEDNNIQYLHNPFLFRDMEHAVDRILQSQEGEKVFVFGDQDVDGMTGTAIIVKTLQEMNIDVSWQVPLINDGYGLSLEAIAKAKESGVSLIITIDCGISNHKEIEYANNLGIDVLVFDHHNVTDSVPDALYTINAKIEEQNYPFKDICAATLALKLRMALAWAKTPLFKQEQFLMNIVPINDAYRFDIMSVRNMVPMWKKSITVSDGTQDVMLQKLVELFQGAPITVYSQEQQQKLINKAFGESIDFYCHDLQSLASKYAPALKNKTLLDVYNQSKFIRYLDQKNNQQNNKSSNQSKILPTPDGATSLPEEIDVLHKLYEFVMIKEFPSYTLACTDMVDVAALAVVADIMPIINENRIIMNLGIEKLESNPSMGTRLLLETIKLNKPREKANHYITSQTIAWQITPRINACGRMGCADIGVKLFLENNEEQAKEYVTKITEFNQQRKNETSKIKAELEAQIEENLKQNKTFIFIYNAKVPATFTGMLAGQFSRKHNVPCVILAPQNEEIISGSIRCVKQFQATQFLKSLETYLLDFGGHKAAAGFSLHQDTLADFQENFTVAMEQHLQQAASSKTEDYFVDLEIAHSDFRPEEIKKLIQFFSPYGEAWPPIHILFSNVVIHSVKIIGPNANHIKLIVQIGAHKVDALLWNYEDITVQNSPLTFEKLSSAKKIDILVIPKVEYYMGIEQLSFVVQQLSFLDI